jgi:hypothetical protein
MQGYPPHPDPYGHPEQGYATALHPGHPLHHLAGKLRPINLDHDSDSSLPAFGQLLLSSRRSRELPARRRPI